MSQAKPQPYKVRNVHVVAKGADVLVREYTLDPGEAIPWHRHSEVSDYYYGLEGVVLIETRNPLARHEIGVGQSATVAPPIVVLAKMPSDAALRPSVGSGPNAVAR